MSAHFPRLHAVTDDRVVGRGGLEDRAAAMAEAAGPEFAVHLRTRVLEGGAFLSLAGRVLSRLSATGSWLVVNERADVARAAGARAVVTGRGGLTTPDVRRVAPAVMVGRSVHGSGEIRCAASERPDFLVAGAVFETASHPGRRPAGLDVVRDAAATGLPVIAIGGITPGRAAEALQSGAHGVAAIRALWDVADPGAAAREFLAAFPTEPPASRVAVNGETRTVPEGTTLEGLLALLGLDPRTVVCEHNRCIVRRDGLGAAVLAEGDSVEIVHFVGGG